MRRAGSPRMRAARCGPRPRPRRPSSGSQRIVIATACKELLGKDFKGIVSSDRWWAYELSIPPRARHAGSISSATSPSTRQEPWPSRSSSERPASELTKRLFETWHAFGEHQDRERLAGEIAPIQAELHELLEHAARKSTYTRFHRRFAKNLLKIWPALWTFVTVEGVDPPTTQPSVRYAGRSSTASSHTAPNPPTASDSSSARCQPRSHAACKPARCSRTCANCSPPTPAATHSQP